MNRRFFILDKFNTWYDWRCTVTAKDVTAPEPKTNYINIEGASGSLDLTEALTGAPVYNDRTVTASFMCSEGDHKEREVLLRRIRTAIHGRKIPIIDPDDPEHYFLGRAKIREETNQPAFLTFTVEAVCDPYRYDIEETTRTVAMTGQGVDLVINNDGDKTLCPLIIVYGYAAIACNGATAQLSTGTYKIADVKLAPGANVVNVSGVGTVAFVYREAVL